jgi:hypothetical protein
VNRFAGRTWPHVREKVFEPLPALTNGNAAFDVTVRPVTIFVTASGQHGLPRTVSARF